MLKKSLIVIFILLLILIPLASAAVCDPIRTKSNLRKALYLHLTSPGPATESAISLVKVKDLLDYYLSSNQLDCNTIASRSLVSYESILAELDSQTLSLPSCSDNTEYGLCSISKPSYCYNGVLENLCSLCGCSNNQTCQVDETCSGAPVSCQLTDAYFSTTNATEGSSVTLTVEGTNCNGLVNFAVYEDDLIGDDPAVLQPASASFSGNTATTAWTAEWVDDAFSDPEYYFIAVLFGEPPIAISSEGSGLLSVSLNLDNIAPSAPGNLMATAVSSSRIDLSWSASTDNIGVAGYKVYRNNVYLANV